MPLPLRALTAAPCGAQALYAKSRMTAVMAQSSIKYLTHLAPALVLPTLQLRIADGLQAAYLIGHVHSQHNHGRIFLPPA